MEVPETRKTYTVTQAAQLLDVDRQVIYRLLRAGRLQGAYRNDPYSQSSDFRIPAAAIEQVIADRAKTGSGGGNDKINS